MHEGLQRAPLRHARADFLHHWPADASNLPPLLVDFISQKTHPAPVVVEPAGTFLLSVLRTASGFPAAARQTFHKAYSIGWGDTSWVFFPGGQDCLVASLILGFTDHVE